MAFTVTYNSSNATSGSVPVDSNSYNAGDQPIILDNTSLIKTNYSFIGWTLTANNTGLVYTAGMSFVIEQNTVLYAYWEYNYIQKSLVDFKLSPSLKIDNLWIDFMGAIATELQLQKQQIMNTRNVKNIYEMQEDDLIAYAQQFGYTPNLVIDNSLQFTLEEIKSIPYRIRNKTTYNGYIFGFKRLGVVGDVFNLFYNGLKLVKAINWVTTFNNLSVFPNLSLPFDEIVPIKNFSVINTQTILQLDTGEILDAPNPWYLDMNTITIPVKHLAVEYFLDKIQTDGTLINPSYMIFYENEVTYNRRVAVYPHVGAQLAIITNDSGYYDQVTAGMTYTIPNIKLNVLSTQNYYLYKASSAQLPKLATYMTLGTGTRGLFNQASGLATIITKAIVALSFDEPYSLAIINNSNDSPFGNLTLTNPQNVKRINSILGTSINFDGGTYVTSTYPVTSNFVLGQTAYQFWFNPNSGIGGQVAIFDHGQLIVGYDYTNSNLLVSTYIGGTLSTQTIACVKNTNHYVYIEIDSSTSIKVYLDNVLTSLTLGTAFTTDNANLSIGYSSHYSNYQGLLDDFVEFNGTNPLLSTTQISYIYNNKVTLTVNSVSKPIYRTPITNGEINLDTLSNRYAVSSTIMGNSISDEFMFIQNSSNATSFSGTLTQGNIVPNMVQFNIFISSGGSSYLEMQVRDNGGGGLKGTLIDGVTPNYFLGTIDYATGNWTLNFTQVVTIFSEQITATSTTLPFTALGQAFVTVAGTSTTINVTTKPLPTISYFDVNGVFHIATTTAITGGVSINPDTSTGGYITGGFLYDTGTYSISLNHVTGSANDPGGLGALFLDYSYNATVLSSVGTYATAEYSVTTQLEVTEVVIEDKNKKALFYSTFPPIKVNSYQDNISPIFFVQTL